MTDTPTTPRRRPRNRKAQILAAAAEAFSERGYHPVGIDDIAATVGISGPALYRHFPTKYALFLHSVMRLADLLTVATDSDAVQAPDAEGRLDAVMTAVIRTTIDNRRTGGLYRWEGRYLVGDDKTVLREKIYVLHDRVKTPLQDVRPSLSDADAALLATAAISVVASITAHRTALSAKQIETMILDAAWSVLRVDLPESGPAEPRGTREVDDSKRELLLRESILLFYRHGYHDVSIEDIGAAASINASSVYRYFPSKSEVLAAAFHRANERLIDTLQEAFAQSSDPVSAVGVLCRLYTELTFGQSELVAVYFAEIGNLPTDQRSGLRNVQRQNIERWAELLREARPELSVVTSRFLVHAALGIVFDVGRTVRFDRSDATVARIQAVMTAVLLG
ncbi:TetR/AcrR family transcriptional regulator [Rhodococcoides kyotonense]|uniref:DNA-binding transcriptional regulator, AcrR family n=1 Tax=Rhodococcoides kyotonense TaxID=398843 RepID=A0A239F9A5_9NOCA|nr:TetR/AcrR family transcriptional regulator [Rhodococcus kyotonensis]SNS53068.1 DNA-binding transcriptional regulator, AcrR family [Rhodococcus kyotonensis]